MNIQRILWILPFLFFLTGYSVLQYIFQYKTLMMPNIVGVPLQDGVRTLSTQNLNSRIIAEKEDPELAEGCIINQNPLPGQKIKQYQTAFLVVSKKPAPLIVPDLRGKMISELQDNIAVEGVEPKLHYFVSDRPTNSCIAHIPAPKSQLLQKQIDFYIAAPSNPIVLMPDLTGYYVNDVLSFLQTYNIVPTILHAREPHHRYHSCTECTVIEQSPRSGTLINIEKKPRIILQLTF